MKIDIFLDVMLHSADQTHVWHLQTKSYAEHKALQGYYEGVRDGLDTVAEVCQGYKNVRLTAKGKMPLENYTDTDKMKVHIMKVCNYLRDLKMEVAEGKFETSQLVNAIDVIHELADKTLYLLTLK